MATIECSRAVLLLSQKVYECFAFGAQPDSNTLSRNNNNNSLGFLLVFISLSFLLLSGNVYE